MDKKLETHILKLSCKDQVGIVAKFLLYWLNRIVILLSLNNLQIKKMVTFLSDKVFYYLMMKCYQI